MILPKTDISIMDVRNALAYPSTDLGTLCSCEHINMWSKYKPVRHNFTTNRPSNWYRGYYNNNGINLVSYSNPKDAGLNNWTYQPPIGGSNSPYRLGDFAGYNSNAMPMTTLYATDRIVDITNIGAISYYAINQNVDSSSNLTWDDFNTSTINLREYYLGVYIEKADSTSTNTFITGDYPIWQSTNDVMIDFNLRIGTREWEKGDYNVYFCLSNIKVEQNASWSGGTFYPFPHNTDNYPITLTIEESLELPFLLDAKQVSVANNYNQLNLKDLSYYEGTSNYLDLSNGNLWFKCTATNNDDYDAYNLLNSDLQIMMFDFNNKEKYITSTVDYSTSYLYLMNTSYVNVDSIRIPANDSVDFFIVISNPALSTYGTLPPTNTKWKARFDFKVKPLSSHGFYNTDGCTLNVSYE